jgi:hypothetical protein
MSWLVIWLLVLLLFQNPILLNLFPGLQQGIASTFIQNTAQFCRKLIFNDADFELKKQKRPGGIRQ